MNAAFGWCWIVAGLLAGAWLGLRFDEDGWLGGYGAYRRRLVRLGHIAMIMLGMLNILFSLSTAALPGSALLSAAGVLLVAGAVLMPIVCVAAAFAPALKPAFALPVLALVAASGATAWLLTVEAFEKGLMP